MPLLGPSLAKPISRGMDLRLRRIRTDGTVLGFWLVFQAQTRRGVATPAGRGAVSIGPSALRVAGLLARMGLQRLEDAVPGVVQDGEWSLLPDLRWRPGRMEDRAPEWRVEFKRFPDAKARTPSKCRRLAGRRFNPQQGGGVEAGAVGQIRDRRKVSTSVTGTRASTAARALRRGRRAGLCGREGIPHAPANGSAWARGQRGRGQHGGRGLTGDGSNEPGEVARHSRKPSPEVGSAHGKGAGGVGEGVRSQSAAVPWRCAGLWGSALNEREKAGGV